jgi:hypothetical protein
VTFEDAWDALHAVAPRGWCVGRPSFYPERNEWLPYPFDPAERAVDGIRKREWTAIAQSEEAVIAEMAWCLDEIRAGRVPKWRPEVDGAGRLADIGTTISAKRWLLPSPR